MNANQESLLYCVYAIAVFDLLCAVLFAVLSLAKIHTHLSWLTIFTVLFGLFWLTLIVLLIFGIYRRNTKLVRYWLIFSCVGMVVEACLILYAFIGQSKFQTGVVANSLILCLGLFVESIFAFIIYQFYQAVAQCTVCEINCPAEAEYQPPKRVQSQPKVKPQPEPEEPIRKSSKRYRCNILQTRGETSSYTCGPVKR